MKRIIQLEANEVFCFGSNLLGIHGARAARDARVLFGAETGVAEGFTGQCYAIPTKRTPRVSLPLTAIRIHVRRFLSEAIQHSNLTFLVTPIGCGLAGYIPAEIALMFGVASPNVILPEEFTAIIRR